MRRECGTALDGIAAYCRLENKVSLGFVEGLNNKIRVIQRRARARDDPRNPDVAIDGNAKKARAALVFTEISTLLQENPSLVYSSLWGGDLQAFVLQAAPRGLMKGRTVVLSASDHVLPPLGNKMPDGVIIGARGSNGQFAEKSPINDWYVAALAKAHPGLIPVQPHYRAAQGLLGLKTAVEKAMAANGGKKPTSEQIAAAMVGIEWDAPSGHIKLALGDGHQAIQSNAAGRSKWDPDAKMVRLVDIEHFAAECVNPPPGIKSVDWIAQGFPGAKCN